MKSFQKEYAERYDWLVTLFKDWAFTFMSSFLYYQDFDMLDDMQKNLYRQGMAAFGGITPTYHIELLDRPTIVWDFHSLLLGVQTPAISKHLKIFLNRENFVKKW